MDSKGKSNLSMAKVVGKSPHPAPRPGLSKAKAVKMKFSHDRTPTGRPMQSERGNVANEKR